jgi:hypothetical protein
MCGSSAKKQTARAAGLGPFPLTRSRDADSTRGIHGVAYGKPPSTARVHDRAAAGDSFEEREIYPLVDLRVGSAESRNTVVHVSLAPVRLRLASAPTLGVFPNIHDVAARRPVFHDRHIRQKHPVSLTAPDHRINPVGQKASCDIAIT